MEKYIANAYLVKEGKLYEPGDEIELTTKQAVSLGKKLKDAPGVETVKETEGTVEKEETKYTEAELRKLGAEEQKAIVQKLGGDLNEITNQDERIDYILNNQ